MASVRSHVWPTSGIWRVFKTKIAAIALHVFQLGGSGMPQGRPIVYNYPADASLAPDRGGPFLRPHYHAQC